jgi:hypothetical protein
MKRARTEEEIKPLIDLCKAGRLFEVQEWIASGKPVNPPLPAEKGRRGKIPLRIAMDSGFHSLVEVLIKGGAAMEEGHYSGLEHALLDRRFDLVKLLVEQGANVHSVTTTAVFETWNTQIIEYFMEKGLDLETGYPLAWALINRIRTALGIFKQYKDRFPSFQEQANIALRHHCTEGNLKWVSLMLWAGADPYAKGPASPEDKPDPEEDLNALQLAALYGQYEIFKLKMVGLDPNRPDALELLRYACHGGKGDLLKMLLDRGFDPKEQEEGGSRLILSLLSNMGYAFDFDSFFEKRKKDIDTSRTREKMKMIHMLARHGATWAPKDKSEINAVRRALLRMTPDYTVEFVWIMSKYNACKQEDLEKLLRAPALKFLVSKYATRINELQESFKNEDPGIHPNESKVEYTD